jgi:hypothetical protein
MTATYEKIITTTLSTTPTDVTLSSIPATYTDLMLIINGSYTFGSGVDSFGIQANGDTGANYSRLVLSGNGSAASSSTLTSGTKTLIGLLGAENTTNIIYINNYSNTTTYKTFLCRANSPSNLIRANVGTWRSTAAINSLLFTGEGNNFASGTTFTIYGIKAE